MKVDFAIITIRPDEYEVIQNRFTPSPYTHPSSKQIYGISQVQTKTGKNCTVAIGRTNKQGNDASQQLANRMINDLDPQMLLVVGIGGGVPDNDFTLGDVIVSSHIHNFDVNAIKGNETSYDVTGGIHPNVSNITANLYLYQSRLAGWNSETTIGMKRPILRLTEKRLKNFIDKDVGEQWRKKVEEVSKWHFDRTQRSARSPKFLTGTIASSNTLIRSDAILAQWLQDARSTLAVDMEVAGVYEAAQRIDHQYPVIAIRGISDIVGFKRNDNWKLYACHTAAAFTYAFIAAGIVVPRGNTKNLDEPGLIIEDAYIEEGQPPSSSIISLSPTPPNMEQVHKPAERSSWIFQSDMTAPSNMELMQVHRNSEVLPAVRREFVGRHAETALFNDALSIAGKPILFFHGIGGIGKSWLINWLITHCQSERTALVDFSEASHLDFLTTMIAIRDQISHKSFKRFNEVLEKYDFIRQAQGMEALKLLKALEQSALQQHHDNERSLYSVTHYLSMPDSERSRILLKAKEDMTVNFQADLLDLTGDSKCVLFFDTIERIDTDTGSWFQKSFLSRLVASPSKNLLLVLSGRKESLWASLAREWNYSIAERELKNFNQAEVEEYLINRNLVKAGQQISQLTYKFTAGHPLCVGLAADLLEEYTQQGEELDVTLMQAYKWDVNSEIISSFLTQRILDRLPPMLTKLILLCSVTHWFDASIIRQLSDASEVFHQHSHDYLEATKIFSFVRPYFKGTRGYTFHEVVRHFLLLKLRRDDPDLFRTFNERALRYFEHVLEHAEARAKSEFIVEKVYHLLVVDEDAGMALFSEMFEHFDKLGKKDVCRRLIEVAAEHEWDEDDEKKWTELFRLLG